MDLTDESFNGIPASGLEHEPVSEQDPSPALDLAPAPAIMEDSILQPAETELSSSAAEPSIPVEESVAEAASSRLQVSALSDVGCVRTNNEDSFGFSEEHGVYIVCDGMGGMASGEIASSTAVSSTLETFAASANSGVPVSTRLQEAILAANKNVWQQGQAPEHKGMGTTLVAAAVDGEKLIIGNVGDSRAYLLQSGHCMQLTVDHSYLNELIRNGTLSMENAHSANLNGMESVITRAIGAHAEVRPDFFAVDLQPGITFLLASDGLTRYLLQDEIALVLLNSPFESTCSNLIQLAKDRGGQDNITCLLLRSL